MKVSRGFVKTAFVVTEKDTGFKYDCFIQDYENYDGTHNTRFNVGINGWEEWHFIHYVDEKAFNERYSID